LRISDCGLRIADCGFFSHKVQVASRQSQVLSFLTL
jgi:hypothetical protein